MKPWRTTGELPEVGTRIEVRWMGMVIPATVVEIVPPWGTVWVLDMEYLSGEMRRRTSIREIRRWRET